MSWTKTNFYLSVITLAIMVFVGLATIGNDANEKLDLNNNSINYILILNGMNEENQYKTISDTSVYNSSQKGILDSDDNSSVSGVNDFLSAFFIKKERAKNPTSYFKVIYNIPASLLVGVGLNIYSNYFKYIISTLVYAIVLALIIMIWRDYIRT